MATGVLTVLDVESRSTRCLLYFINMIRVRNICGMCNVQFATRVELSAHMQDHTETFTCDCCNMICESWLSFVEHVRSSHSSLVFCPYCYKAHTNFWRLRLHWRMHEPYDCIICYHTFSTLSNLREHHNLQHPETPFYLPFCSAPLQREE